jgi:3-deoxy-7-phosphoheptulonate synthase
VIQSNSPAVNPTYRLASRKYHPENTLVCVGEQQIGSAQITIMAGPCAVESRAQILEIASWIKAANGSILRGGAFKPRSSPYSFQGLGEEGLQLLAEARQLAGLPIVTEVMEPAQVSCVAFYADILQVGARNMQNYPLLRAVGNTQKPILLKRGMGNTLEELLQSAEYILSEGNPNVILCERGIRTFETSTRNTFDLNAIPVLKDLTHLPVIADPSHGVGDAKYVTSVAKGAIAAGADGLIVEVHPDPSQALSDGKQSLSPSMFSDFMREIAQVAHAVGRQL